MSKFSERVKELRASHQLTQKQVAEYIGIKQRSYQRYEGTEERNPSLAALQQVADFYKVSTDYLLGRTDNPAPRN